MFGPFKKEKPIQGFSGFGGGATGAAFRTSGGGGPGAPVSPKGASGGAIITDNPSYIFHRFLTSDNGQDTGEFWCGPSWGGDNLEILVVGGGGGGGCDDYPGNRGGGGGGGGGVYAFESVPTSAGTTRTVTVGSGGPGAFPNETKNPLGVSSPGPGEYKGAPGTSSWFGEVGDDTPENYVARGGGGGGSHTKFQSIAQYTPGADGRSMQEQPDTYWPADRQGSGGGGSNGQSGGTGQGEGSPGTGTDYGGGGGGGAGQNTNAGGGGAGAAWPDLPTPSWPYVGAPEGKFGGGGGGRQNSPGSNQGGPGGGGNGWASGSPAGNPGVGEAGTQGLGGGGGASREQNGGEGGGGVVLVRYPA